MWLFGRRMRRGNWIPAGLLVVRSPDEESLPDSGFVFTGSCMVDEGGVLLYEADVHGPNSLISLYNEPQDCAGCAVAGSTGAGVWGTDA